MVIPALSRITPSHPAPWVEDGWSHPIRITAKRREAVGSAKGHFMVQLLVVE
jgi:hypothetical protein